MKRILDDEIFGKNTKEIHALTESNQRINRVILEKNENQFAKHLFHFTVEIETITKQN